MAFLDAAMEMEVKATEGGTKVNKKLGWLIFMLALALCVSALPAMAQTLFSDLGPPGDQYNCCQGATEVAVAASQASAILTPADSL
ncbi:MAG TPA: hypothetical protein VII29_17950 [Terriglobales bacterium]